MKSGLFQFDPNPSVVPPGSITNAELAPMAALTVKANPTNASGQPQDVAAAANDRLFARTGDALSFQQLTDGMVPTNTVALSKLANAGAQYDIVGRKTAAGGAWEDCTRTDLKLAGTDLANTFLGVPQIVQENGATQQYLLQIVRVDAGNSGPYIQSYHDTSSPAANDFIGGWHWFSRDSANNKQFYAGLEVKVLDPTSGSEDSELQFYSEVAGLTVLGLRVGDGVQVGSPTGSYQGAGTINAVNYFDDGVNINAIYAALASANVFTNQQQIVGGVAQTSTGAALSVQATNAGGVGPMLSLYYNPATGANGDGSRFAYWFKNSAGNPVRSVQLTGFIDSVTAGAENGSFAINTIQAGSLAARLTIGAGVYVAGADPGVGNFNASGYYINGSVAVDSNGLPRLRTFTFGTLPAAAGVPNGIAIITDALGAVWTGAAAGGGSGFVKVYSSGSGWIFG